MAFSARLNGGASIPVGETRVASLADGQWGSATFAWTPALAGSYEISAVIDPQTGSGTTWAYFQTWEFDANLNAWVPVDASGWLPYTEGAPNHYAYGYSSWPGPRILGAWAAGNAENITPQAAAALTNYIAPIDVLFQNESRWYLFYLNAGQLLNVSAHPGLASDVDLYIWPSDYPAHPVVASAQDGQAVESLNYSAPTDGYYWVEIYGYLAGSYTLTVNGAGQLLPTAPSAPSAGTPSNKPVHTPGITLNNLPPMKSRLAPIWRTTFLPAIVR